MILQLDPGSPVPPYEQLRAQITTMVATGVVPAGGHCKDVDSQGLHERVWTITAPALRSWRTRPTHAGA